MNYTKGELIFIMHKSLYSENKLVLRAAKFRNYCPIQPDKFCYVEYINKEKVTNFCSLKNVFVPTFRNQNELESLLKEIES
jgi:hypothetical protein